MKKFSTKSSTKSRSKRQQRSERTPLKSCWRIESASSYKAWIERSRRWFVTKMTKSNKAKHSWWDWRRTPKAFSCSVRCQRKMASMIPNQSLKMNQWLTFKTNKWMGLIRATFLKSLYNVWRVKKLIPVRCNFKKRCRRWQPNLSLKNYSILTLGTSSRANRMKKALSRSRCFQKLVSWLAVTSAADQEALLARTHWGIDSFSKKVLKSRRTILSWLYKIQNFRKYQPTSIGQNNCPQSLREC